MQGANLLFRSDPIAFLRANAVCCYNGEAQQKSDINRIDGNTLNVTQEFQPQVDFDLVSNPQGYYDLKLVGGQGAFRSSSLTRRLGYGDPIVGNYIPYLGQKDKKPSNLQFGKINLSRVQTNFVFTFTFTGCNFVVTTVGGETFVYHEPTSEAWGSAPAASRYPGETIVATIGPRYDDTHIGGYGCLARIGGKRWNVCVQTFPMNGIRVDDLQVQEIVAL